MILIRGICYSIFLMYIFLTQLRLLLNKSSELNRLFYRRLVWYAGSIIRF